MSCTIKIKYPAFILRSVVDKRFSLSLLKLTTKAQMSDCSTWGSILRDWCFFL